MNTIEVITNVIKRLAVSEYCETKLYHSEYHRAKKGKEDRDEQIIVDVVDSEKEECRSERRHNHSQEPYEHRRLFNAVSGD